MDTRWRTQRASIVVIAVFLLPAAVWASAVEHPGVLHQDDNCSSCHADKVRGRSVHSSMATSCTVCHVAQTQGDMTTLDLMMPKQQICFACHQTSAKLEQHAVKGACLGCHDAHRSNRRMLLREGADTRQTTGPGPDRTASTASAQ